MYVNYFNNLFCLVGVDCPDSAFECENKGQGFNVPECISKDHVCDGQPQCADGSDEETCAPPPSSMYNQNATQRYVYRNISMSYLSGELKNRKKESPEFVNFSGCCNALKKKN